MEKNRKSTVRYALSGGLTGLINGFFGAGGGMLLVPLLTGFCAMEDKKAFASSVAIILPICLTSLGVYALNGDLQVADALPYLLGGAVGGFLGGKFFKKVSAGFLHKALGILILWGGIRLVVK